jgi:hypothetical protein
VEGFVLLFLSLDSERRRSWLQIAVVGAVMAVMGNAALAANHTISGKTSTFECNSVKPGDTLTLPSGTRGPLRIPIHRARALETGPRARRG